MIYEAQISYENEKGKTVKNNFVLAECERFSDAENVLYFEFEQMKNFTVLSLRKSKIKEIANGIGSDEDCLWLAELKDVFTNDEGEEKQLKYKILFFSRTYDSANAFISEYVKMGYDMQLVSMKLTNFSGVI